MSKPHTSVLFGIIATIALLFGCGPKTSSPVSPSSNSDLRSCGLVWDHDDGNVSVWRATRYASVGISSQDSSGRWVEGHIPLSPGQFVRITMFVQRARCL